MGINCGGVYVRTKAGVDQDAVRDAVRAYWTGRGARAIDEPPSAFDRLSLSDTGRLALGVFPEAEGWIGIYDSERYTSDPDLAEHLAAALGTWTIAWTMGEVSDTGDIQVFGEGAPDDIPAGGMGEPAYEAMAWIEANLPYPFVYFDEVPDDVDEVHFLAFDQIPPGDGMYAGPDEARQEELRAQAAIESAVEAGDLSEVHARLAKDASEASAFVKTHARRWPEEAQKALLALALEQPALRIPGEWILQAHHEAFEAEDWDRVAALAELFRAHDRQGESRGHFARWRPKVDPAIRAGDYDRQIPLWETVILAAPDDAQSLYATCFAYRIARDGKDEATRERMTARIAVIGDHLANLTPDTWYERSCRAYAMNDCFAYEGWLHAETEEELERALAYSEKSLGEFAWNLYHQLTKADLLRKLGRTEEAFLLMRWVESVHPRLLKDQEECAKPFDDEYRAWCESQEGEPAAPADAEWPEAPALGGLSETHAEAQSPWALPAETVCALLAAAPTEGTAWERARAAALLAFVCDPAVRVAARGEGAMRYWLAALQFPQVDLRADSFAEQTLAPETLARVRQWYVLSTINPHMNRTGIPVYLFGEWEREAPSPGWIVGTIEDAVARAGLPAETTPEVLMVAAPVSAGPRVMPLEGLEHPSLVEVGREDTLEAMLLLHVAAEPPPSAFLEAIGEGQHWLLRGQGAAARHELTELLATLPAGALRELAIRRLDANGEVFDDAAWSEAPTDEEEAFFRASFEAEPPLPSEPDEVPEMHNQDGVVPELRLAPFRREGVRAVHGIVDVEDLEWAPACSRLARALHAHLSERFGIVGAPSWFNKEGEDDGPLDHIEAYGREGFAFAVGLDDTMVQGGPTGIRLREHELLHAIADLIADPSHGVALSPTFHWVRNDPYIVNLWKAD